MKISQAVIVEGTYDKIKLAGITDAVVVTTDGFDIFQNTEKLGYIRRLAKSCGIVILTDSDRAGFLIRNHIRGAVKEGTVLNAYIPDIAGKEHRKKKSSREGLLGVEGVPDEVIKKALLRAGCTSVQETEDVITRQHFFEDGLMGGVDSSLKREALAEQFDLPRRLSCSGLLSALNKLTDYADYKAAVNKIFREEK